MVVTASCWAGLRSESETVMGCQFTRADMVAVVTNRDFRIVATAMRMAGEPAGDFRQ